MLLFLIGLRGAGKSTLGRSLAQRLHLDFIDLDERTARHFGTPTAGDALRTLGEPAFRAGEAAALHALVNQPRADAVIALGGGTPTAPDARALIDDLRRTARARVVYLRASPTTLQDRLRRESLANRPSLTGADPIAEVPTIFAMRDPIYRALADAVIDADRDAIVAIEDELERTTRRWIVSG